MIHPLQIPEIQTQIVRQLDSSSLVRILQVSKPWLAIGLPILWSTISIQDWDHLQVSQSLLNSTLFFSSATTTLQRPLLNVATLVRSLSYASVMDRFGTEPLGFQGTAAYGIQQPTSSSFPRDLELDNLVQILFQCRHLQRVSVHRTTLGIDHGLIQSIMELSHLTSLDLSASVMLQSPSTCYEHGGNSYGGIVKRYGQIDVKWVLENCKSLDRLKKLELSGSIFSFDGYGHHHHDDEEEGQQVVGKILLRLENVKLDTPHLTEDELIGFLECCPKLTSLELYDFVPLLRTRPLSSLPPPSAVAVGTEVGQDGMNVQLSPPPVVWSLNFVDRLGALWSPPSLLSPPMLPTLVAPSATTTTTNNATLITVNTHSDQQQPQQPQQRRRSSAFSTTSTSSAQYHSHRRPLTSLHFNSPTRGIPESELIKLLLTFQNLDRFGARSCEFGNEALKVLKKTSPRLQELDLTTIRGHLLSSLELHEYLSSDQAKCLRRLECEGVWVSVEDLEMSAAATAAAAAAIAQGASSSSSSSSVVHFPSHSGTLPTIPNSPPSLVPNGVLSPILSSNGNVFGLDSPGPLPLSPSSPPWLSLSANTSTLQQQQQQQPSPPQDAVVPMDQEDDNNNDGDQEMNDFQDIAASAINLASLDSPTCSAVQSPPPLGSTWPQSLEYLSIGFSSQNRNNLNQCCDVIFSHLSQLVRLETLKINNSTINLQLIQEQQNDHGLKRLRVLNRLQEFSIESCGYYPLQRDQVLWMLQHWPDLKILRINHPGMMARQEMKSWIDQVGFGTGGNHSCTGGVQILSRRSFHSGF